MVEAQDLDNRPASRRADHMRFGDTGIVHDGDDVGGHVGHAIDAQRLGAFAGAAMVVQHHRPCLSENRRLIEEHAARPRRARR